MRRLLAVYGGSHPVSGQFWLLDAPDDLQDLGRLNPDGAGIGWYDEEGTPHLDRAPVQALMDPAFARDARTVSSRAILAHVRHSSGTPRALANTMPFLRGGRLFAHNGALGDLPTVERLAGPWATGLDGSTDSERYLALISRRAHELGSLADGVISAAREIAVTVPVLSLNCVIVTPRELVALRYPETDTLFVLFRPAGLGIAGSGADGPIRVEGDQAAAPHIVIASEPLDDDPGWRPLASGELLHISRDLAVTTTVALPEPPVIVLAL